LVGIQKISQIFKTVENSEEIEKLARKLSLLSWQGEQRDCVCGSLECKHAKELCPYYFSSTSSALSTPKKSN
jgi:hypothetical protein